MGGDTNNIRSIPIVREFLLDPDVLGRLEEMQVKYGLPEERAVEHLTLTRAVLDGVITLDHMPALIAEAFGVDEENAKRIACDVVGYRLLPLEEYFPGSAQQIVAWGGSVDNYPPIRIGKEKVTTDHYAGRITEELSLALQPNHIKRLGFLVASYMKGDKTRESTATFFARPVNIGGLGLAPDVAEKVIAYVEERKDKIDLVDDPTLETFQPEVDDASDEAIESEFAEIPVASALPAASDAPVPEVAPIQPPTEARVAVTPEPVVAAVLPTADGAQPAATSVASVVVTPSTTLPEIASSHELATTAPIAAGRDLPKSPVAPLVDDLQKEVREHEKVIVKKGLDKLANDDQLEHAVRVACTAAAPQLVAAKIQESAFADVARLAIKGVRDPYQTRGVLEREFGVTGETVLLLLESIMQGMAEFNTAGDVGRNGQDAGAGLSTLASTPQNIAVMEREVLDKRFAAVAQKMPPTPVEPVMPNAQVSAARTKDEELALQSQKVDPVRLEVAAEASRPEPARAELTVGSVPPPKFGEQKVMTDVQYKPRLVGPVEELGTMTPADFRRLSSNPQEAARKIEDIMSTLESTGYDERIRGVQAWRKSPVYVMYLAMAQEALQEGVAMAEVASRRRNKGEESLSPAEIKAISLLNAQVRF